MACSESRKLFQMVSSEVVYSEEVYTATNLRGCVHLYSKKSRLLVLLVHVSAPVCAVPLQRFMPRAAAGRQGTSLMLRACPSAFRAIAHQQVIPDLHVRDGAEFQCNRVPPPDHDGGARGEADGPACGVSAAAVNAGDVCMMTATEHIQLTVRPRVETRAPRKATVNGSNQGYDQGWW